MTDDDLRRDFALMRKFVYTVAGCDGDTNFPEAVRRAIKNWEKTQERLAELDSVVETDLSLLDYEQMTKKDRVRYIQQKLVKEAQDQNGKAALNYKEVIWLFDGEPSTGYAYKLMNLAGEEPGFDYQKFDDDRLHRLRVDLARVNAEAGFHAVNDVAEGGDA